MIKTIDVNKLGSFNQGKNYYFSRNYPVTGGSLFKIMSVAGGVTLTRLKNVNPNWL
jgi:hypothetical protein